MQRLNLRPPSSAAELVGGQASDSHWTRLIEPPVVIYATPADPYPWAIYTALPGEWRDLGDNLQTVPRHDDIRTGGLMSRARTFGSQPRIAVRRKDNCYRSYLDRERPDLIARFIDLAAAIEPIYAEYRPDVYHHHQGCARGVRPEWRLGDAIFTSGIINYDSSLIYHRDRGNFPRTWNAMVVFRQHADGGNFVVPGGSIAFGMPDQSLLLMDAQSITHGVTEVHKRRRNGYRTSVVYYSLAQLCKCGSPDEELERARKKRTEREWRRAGLIE